MPDVATAPSSRLERVDGLAGERVADIDLERSSRVRRRAGRRRSRRPSVAAAEPGGEEVGGEALAGAAGVEADAGRAADGSSVDADRASRRAGSGAARRARRRRAARAAASGSSGVAAVAVVAGGLERRRPASGRRARRCARPPTARGDRGPQERRGRDLARAGGVEPAQLAVGAEAGERGLEVLEELAAAAAVASSPTTSRAWVPMQSKVRSVMTSGWSSGAGAGAGGRRGAGAGAGGRGRRGAWRCAAAARRCVVAAAGRCSTIRVTITRRISTRRGAGDATAATAAARPRRSPGRRRARIWKASSGHDREEQPERAGDHRERTGLADRAAARALARRARGRRRRGQSSSPPRPRPRPRPWPSSSSSSPPW